MGIKNISLLLSQKCKDSMQKKNLKIYKNKVLAIDISIYLYKYLYNNDDHIEGLTRQILRLYKNGITPLYIFDGAPPKEKNEVLKGRFQKKTNYINKKNELLTEINKLKNKEDTNTEDIDKLEKDIDKVSRKIIHVTSTHIEKCKTLFNLFGIPYIVSDSEAESLCAKLCSDKLVHGCISEDTDILANGGNIFIRNFNASNNYINEYSLPVILKSLHVNYSQFIDICILCGCDYTTKIKGIGPINAHKYIKKYENIDNIIKQIQNENNKSFHKYIIPENFNYKKAKELFIDIQQIETNQYINVIKLNKPRINELIEFIKQNSTKLHQKYYKELSNSLFNYYSNTITI
jgi:flap endonuclease-1